ncbi:MAG: heptosyltransferase [Verrucomicrobiota bacterium]
MRDRLVYVFYRFGVAIINALPPAFLFHLGRVAGFFAWLLLARYRRLALHNATIALGKEKSGKELRCLVRRHFRQLGANLLCGVKMAMVPLAEINRYVQIENLDVIDGPLRAGRPVVLILSHLGNWELTAHVLPAFVGHFRNGTIYQRLGNPLIDAHVRKLRERAKVELFDRREGFAKPIQLLRGGGVIGVLSDQHAGDQGLWVPFFGRLASTTSLPALLAKRTEALLVGVAVYTAGPARWRIDIGPALETNDESIESLTSKANELIAAQIRRAPEDWFWVHDRWKTPRPNFLLNKYKRGFYLPKAMPSDDLQPFRVLIRANNWLGDAVMSVPAVRAIKRGRPDTHVTVLTTENLAPLWKLVPDVDEIISVRGKSLFSAVRWIRGRPEFDAAILFPNSLRSALEAWLAGIPRRVGYRGHFRAWLLNQIVREPKRARPPEHQSLRYLRIARELGADVQSDAEESLNTQLSTLHVQPSISKPPTNGKHGLIGLCAGAEYGPAKRWLPERFAEAAAAITTETSARWILFGTAKDSSTGEAIVKALGDNCINRIGQTDLQQLIDELRTCHLLLTNDTGTMHLAALLGIPIVAIFGSTEPRLTGPMGTRHIILRHHVECSPCFLRECPIDFRCMKAVSVQEVVDAVRSILLTGHDAAASPGQKVER